MTPSFELLMLNVGYARQHGDWNWRNVRSPFARLYCVTEGAARIVFRSTRAGEPDRTLALRPGGLYLVPPFTLHHEESDGLFAHYYVHIYERAESDIRLFEDYALPAELPSSPLHCALFGRLAAINPQMALPESNPQSYDNQSYLLHSVRRGRERSLADIVESAGIVHQLIAPFLRQARPQVATADSRILQSIARIRRHLTSTPDLADLASRACMSKDHFIRCFRQVTGQPPGAYIARRRMEQAELQLIMSDRPVKQIARAMGYADCSYFNRVFRKWVGMTPQEYRRQTAAPGCPPP